MHGFYCTNAINFSCQCAAAAAGGTAAELPFFLEVVFVFHFFYCKVIKKHSSSTFFSVPFHCFVHQTNVFIKNRRQKKSTKWNNEDKGKTLLLGTLLLLAFAQTFCTILKEVKTKFQKSWKSFVSHFMALRSLSFFFALVLPFSTVFPLFQLRTIDPQRQTTRSLVEIFFASLLTVICFMIYR